MVFSPTFIYGGVENRLAVQRWARWHMFLPDMYFTTKEAGNVAASKLHMLICPRLSHAYKLVTMVTQLPSCIVYLLTFDEYCRTAVKNGCGFVGKGQF